MTNIKDYRLDFDQLRFFGQNLNRPESIVATPDGTLWASDKQAAVIRIDPDGTQTQVGEMGSEPNGLAMDREGSLYVANIGDGKFYKLYPDGTEEVILSEFDGQPLGAPNFVFIDRGDRIWLSVSTRRSIWFEAAANPRPDGYILLMDENGVRMVADGIYFPNEIRLDAKEEYLYVAETMKARMLRFPVKPDGSLGDRQVFGPDPLDYGAWVDGFTFDVEGNLWITTPLRNGLGVLTADGDYHVVFEDMKPEALRNAIANLEANQLQPEDIFACAGETLQFPTSVTFAGSDLRTVYVGSLIMPHLITFESPIPGLPMRHWH
jgi:sugar lactone lactonase YvrE